MWKAITAMWFFSGSGVEQPSVPEPSAVQGNRGSQSFVLISEQRISKDDDHGPLGSVGVLPEEQGEPTLEIALEVLVLDKPVEVVMDAVPEQVTAPHVQKKMTATEKRKARREKRSREN